jgi:hypothetical protein
MRPSVTSTAKAYESCGSKDRSYLACFDAGRIATITTLLHGGQQELRKRRYLIFPSRFNRAEQCAGLYYLEDVRESSKFRIPLFFDGIEVHLNAFYYEGYGSPEQVRMASESVLPITSVLSQWYDAATIEEMKNAYCVGVTSQPATRIHYK